MGEVLLVNHKVSLLVLELVKFFFLFVAETVLFLMFGKLYAVPSTSSLVANRLFKLINGVSLALARMNTPNLRLKVKLFLMDVMQRSRTTEVHSDSINGQNKIFS